MVDYKEFCENYRKYCCGHDCLECKLHELSIKECISCTEYILKHYEECQAIFYDYLNPWKRLKKGTVIVVNFASKNEPKKDEQLRIFDHYDETLDLVHYIIDSCLTGATCTANRYNCRVYRGC